MAPAVVQRLADRVIATCTQRMFQTLAIASPRRRRAARALWRTTAGLAHTAKLLPRVDVSRLSAPGADWQVTFVGDPHLRPQLELALFGREARHELVGHVPTWRLLGEAVARGLTDTPLVVCSLPEGFPARWRPSAPLSFRMPVFVDHQLDLTVPLAEQLRGTARQEVRQLVARARRSGIRVRVTRDEGALRRFHAELLEPFQRARHGPFAMVSRYEVLANRFRRLDYELLELVLDGHVVGGSLVQYLGPVAGGRELGLRTDVPPEVARALPTAALLSNIERSIERGCTEYRFGASRAFYCDPVFRAKRRWGARTIPREYLSHPEWTWLARSLPAPLARHINGLGPLTFHDGKSLIVRVAVDGDADLPAGPIEGVEGCLAVSEGRSRLLTFDEPRGA